MGFGKRKVALNDSDDIIIPILGPTGAGKSTFINTACKKSTTPVGHGLESCTGKIQVATVRHPPTGRNVVFVDTPGFDDTNLDDSEILKLIADWLKKHYKEGKKLSGIIYLYEISQNRMFGATRKNMKMFGKLCGDRAAQNVILATTKWAHLKDTSVGVKREIQLRDLYWKEMIKEGSRVARFQNDTPDAAWAIVDLILEKEPIKAILIQEELVDIGKQLPETQAGLALRAILKDLVREIETEAEKIPEGDPRYDQLMEKAQQALGQAKKLKIPVGRKVASFLSFRKAKGKTVET